MVAEDGWFPCDRISGTAVRSERRGVGKKRWERCCLGADSQGRHVRPPPREKRARWCCLEQTQFKVEAGAAGMNVEAAATLLVGILSKRGIEAMAKQLIELIKLGQRWGHFVDTRLLYSVS